METAPVRKQGLPGSCVCVICELWMFVVLWRVCLQQCCAGMILQLLHQSMDCSLTVQSINVMHSLTLLFAYVSFLSFVTWSQVPSAFTNKPVVKTKWVHTWLPGSNWQPAAESQWADAQHLFVFTHSSKILVLSVHEIIWVNMRAAGLTWFRFSLVCADVDRKQVISSHDDFPSVSLCVDPIRFLE